MSDSKSEKVTLINKVVKAVDSSSGIDTTGIIAFMYPNYKLREEIFFDYDNDVLYIGKYSSSLRKELERGTKSFIALSSIGVQDIDFTNRETAIKVLYSKWDKEPSENAREALEHMSEYEFWDFFKKYWVLGRSKLDEKGAKLYELHSLLGKRRYDILKKYFELREFYSDSVIFGSVLGFLEKAINTDKLASGSGRYKKTVEEFGKEYGDFAISVIKQAYVMKCSNDSDKEYRTLWILMQLGKGNII